MLNRTVEKARQREVFFREDTPIERRFLAAFLYHAGLSYRRIEPLVDRSHEAIRQWFHRLKHFFEPDCRDRQEVAVDETKVEIDGDEHYVWAAVDCETLEVLSVEVTPGRSSLVTVFERRSRAMPRSPAGANRPRPMVRLAA